MKFGADYSEFMYTLGCLCYELVEVLCVNHMASVVVQNHGIYCMLSEYRDNIWCAIWISLALFYTKIKPIIQSVFKKIQLLHKNLNL